MAAPRKWTEDKVFQMRRMAASGKDVTQIAEHFGVTQMAIYQQAHIHGFSVNQHRPKLDPAKDGNQFYTARVNAGLSQQVAADRIGCSVMAIQNWERGRAYPTMSIRRTIDKVYGSNIFDGVYPRAGR